MTKSGILLDLQRTCFYDGPGIRSTVFLKAAHFTVYGAIILNRFLSNRRFLIMPKNVFIVWRVLWFVRMVPSRVWVANIHWIMSFERPVENVWQSVRTKP